MYLNKQNNYGEHNLNLNFTRQIERGQLEIKNLSAINYTAMNEDPA